MKLGAIRLVCLLAALPGFAFAANNWVDIPAISPTTSLVADRICYTDGRDLACDGAAGLLTTSGTIQVTTVSGTNLYALSVSGSSGTFGSIGVGNINASGQITATTLTVGTVSSSGGGTVSATNGYFANLTADTITGGNIAASSMNWYGLTNIPAPVQNISNGTGPISATSFYAALVSTTNTGTVSGYEVYGNSISGSTGSFGSIGVGNINASGQITATTLTVGTVSSTGGGTVSATYGYFSYISATNGLSTASGDRIVSGSTSVVANSVTSVISFTSAGVVAGYIDSSGRHVVPGISVTTNQTSVTSLYASGLVGIGTTAPATNLDVQGSNSSGTQGIFNVTNKGTATFLGDLLMYNPNLTAGQDAYFSMGVKNAANDTASFGFTYAADGSTSNRLDIDFYGKSPLMSILAGGNVGIGTVTPTYPLEVTGIISATGLYVTTTTGTVSATYGYFKYISATSGLGGAGVSYLASLTDVSVSSPPTNNGILTYVTSASKWEAISLTNIMNVSTTTMVPNFPDAIECNVSNPSTGQMIFIATAMPDQAGGYYYITWDSNTQYILGYNSDGSYSVHVNFTTSSCDNKSISQLYASGQAFNFLGSNLNSAASPNTGIQYSNNGVLAADANNEWISGTATLSVTGVVTTTNLYASSISGSTGTFGSIGVGNINASGQITATAVGATLISATAATGTVSATYGYFKYISATSGLSTASGDRIVSGSLSAIANSATGYISLTTGATNWGYLSSGASFIPTLGANTVSSSLVSATIISTTALQIVSQSTSPVSCNTANAGSLIYSSSTTTLELCTGTGWQPMGVGIPAGTISAFASTTCPTGWSEYTAARGRFLRGIDNGAGLDPNGTRAPGNQQADAFQSHEHSFNNAFNAGTQANVGSGAAFYYTSSGSNSGVPVSDGTNGTPRTSSETRPVNVAVTFCQFNGTSNGWNDPLSGGGTTTPGGNSNDLQYDGGGSFAGSDNFQWLNSSNTVSVTGVVSATNFYGLGVSGSTGTFGSLTVGTINGTGTITTTGTINAATISTTGTTGTVSATYGYFANISGSGAGLYNIPASAVTGLSSDRIVSGNTLAVVNSATSYISLSTAGTVWGYLTSATSWLPALAGNSISSSLVSSTNISVTISDYNSNTVTALIGGGGNYIVSGSASVSTTSTGQVNFSANNTLAMTISGTNVGIGTANPGGKLEVDQSQDNHSLYAIGGLNYLQPSSSSASQGLEIDGTNLHAGSNGILLAMPSGWTGNFIEANLNGAPQFYVTQNGNIYGNLPNSAAGYYVCYNSSTGQLLYGGACNDANSDIRLKQDISPLRSDEGLTAIMRLKPVHFRWRDVSQDKSEGPQIGLIAQDVKGVLPELVTDIGADATVHLSDSRTEVVKDIQGLKYQLLVFPLIRAVQELKADNDNLRALVEQQGREIEELKQMNQRKPAM